MSRLAFIAVVVLLMFAVGSTAQTGREIGPETDWCEAANGLGPGEELILRPGEYQGECSLRRGGSEGAPIVIRGSDRANPPRIVYLGNSSNVVNVRAAHVTLRNLAFGPTLPSVDAVRVYGGGGVVVEDCVFSDLGGIAVVANHSSLHGLTIRRNRVVRSRATAVYVGCHDGASCIVTGILLENNYLHGVDAPQGEIGYGIQIKLNSEAIVRDNLVIDTKGPGIMVYGSSDATRRSVVERNFVAASRTASGIVVGGGPVIVRNNVAVRNAHAGVAVEDYARRSLLRDIAVAHNTIWNNGSAGITVDDSSRLDVMILGNAVHSRPPTVAFPRPRTGILSVGNRDCSVIPCFQNPWSDNFAPVSSSAPGLPWRPDLVIDDYFTSSRPSQPAVGAIEPPGRPIRLEMKSLDR